MNSNDTTDDPMKTYYMKTGKNSLSQMPVRQFVGSLNLKIPALKIYSFKYSSEQAQRKPTTTSQKSDPLPPQSKSAKIETTKPLDPLDQNTAKIEAQTANFLNSMATTETSYKRGLPEIKTNKTAGRPLVMKNYKGFQEKIQNPLKKTGVTTSRNEAKPLSREKEKIEKCPTTEKKYVGIDTLKGIMLEGMEVFEGFSESTIRIEPEYETAEESRRDILEFLENPMFKK